MNISSFGLGHVGAVSLARLARDRHGVIDPANIGEHRELRAQYVGLT